MKYQSGGRDVKKIMTMAILALVTHGVVFGAAGTEDTSPSDLPHGPLLPWIGEEVVWQGFGRDGKPAGSFLVPGRFRVFEIGRDYVLGKWWDELDVEHVQLYALTPSGG